MYKKKDHSQNKINTQIQRVPISQLNEFIKLQSFCNLNKMYK